MPPSRMRRELPLALDAYRTHAGQLRTVTHCQEQPFKGLLRSESSFQNSEEFDHSDMGDA